MEPGNETISVHLYTTQKKRINCLLKNGNLVHHAKNFLLYGTAYMQSRFQARRWVVRKMLPFDLIQTHACTPI